MGAGSCHLISWDLLLCFGKCFASSLQFINGVFWEWWGTGCPHPSVIRGRGVGHPCGKGGKNPSYPKPLWDLEKPKGASLALHPPSSQEGAPAEIQKIFVFFLGKTQFPARCRSRWVGFSIFSLAQGITAPRCPQARREPAEAHGREDAGQVNPGAPSSCLCPCPGNPRIPVLLIDHVRSFLSGDWPLLLNLF